jgi:hypothetical protein
VERVAGGEHAVIQSGMTLRRGDVADAAMAVFVELLAKLSARVREFPARITTLDRKLVISSDSRHICRRATSFQSFQASR